MTPVYTLLDYSATALTSLFSALADAPWAMMLSSGDAEHADNRFDIMVCDPKVTLITHGETTAITDEQGVVHSTDDPLALLQSAIDALHITGVPNEAIPFHGGALGLFGYDLGRRYEHIASTAQQDIHTPDMAIGIYDWALVADHHLHRLTLVTTAGDAARRLAWLQQQQPAREPTAFMLTSAWQSNMSFADYQQKFAAVQRYLLAGDCYQVNLAQRFQATYRGDEWQAFCLLNQQNRAPFSAFLRLPQGAILSLSPERFLALNEGQIETRPIKGTLPRLHDAAADRQQAIRLANSEKDRAENLMIVDLLRNDIGRVAMPGSVSVPELFVVEPFPAVHHLVSTIRARLWQGLQPGDLLRACFPGGSITGAPKVRAMQIIEELEPQRRNAWCGSIGYISVCGRMDTNIAIRTLIAEKGQIYCAAGGGIVADSQVEAEYEETLHKLQRILPCLPMDVNHAS